VRSGGSKLREPLDEPLDSFSPIRTTP